jgi:hypothetical protein
MKRRTIYFNDARHYYLFVFEPPMTLEDAWRPIDEVAGTAVDTLVYGVARGDGLFYPSKVGLYWGSDTETFASAIYWRVWNNMQSLIKQGLDPLGVLIDRAHAKGMEFFSSLRMGDIPGLDSSLQAGQGGDGYMNEQIRDHQFAVLKELAHDYAADGVELDFAAAPGGTSFAFKPEDVKDGISVMNEWIRGVSAMVREGGSRQVGARIYPTEEMNLAAGLDVRTWLKEKLIDYVNPMRYSGFVVDMNKPFDWVVDPAHEAGASVYPMVQAYYKDSPTIWATPAMMRAAAASYFERGADGIYTWFFDWPLGDAERRMLTEIGDPDLLTESDKHYFVSRSSAGEYELPYSSPLPIEIPISDVGKRHTIPFHIADDVEARRDRIRQIQLKINFGDMISADRIGVWLNGESLADETCLRDYGGTGLAVIPYSGQWIEFHLEKVLPRKGENTLEIVLESRPERVGSTMQIEDVEIIIQYGSYPSGLGR